MDLGSVKMKKVKSLINNIKNNMIYYEGYTKVVLKINNSTKMINTQQANFFNL